MGEGVKHLRSASRKISVFLLTTPLSWQPILAGLLGLTMQSAMQSGSKWLHVPTLYSQLPSSSTVAKATLYYFKQSRVFSLWKTFWSTVIVNTHRPRRVGEKSIYVLLKSLPGKANSSIRVKTKPYQAIFAFLCVPIVVVVLLVKSFHPKWPRSFYTEEEEKTWGKKYFAKKKTLAIFVKH